MNKNIIWAIASKDIRSITSNVQIWLAMILLPIIISVVFPVIVILLGKSIDITSLSGIDMIQSLIQNLPEGTIKDMLTSLGDEKLKVIYMFVNYMLLPLFLMVPTMISMMIAANSFVGEKERKTLESLLFAPIQIRDLFIGKVLASFIPAMVITIGSFLLSGLIIDILTYPMYHQLIFPNWNWIVMIFWIVPIMTLFTILFNVLISARVKGFQEAQQIGGLVVLPIVALLISQVTGLILINPWILFLIGLILFGFSLFLLQRIAKMNQRNLLFERQVH